MVLAVLALGVFLWNVSTPPHSRPAITQEEQQAIFGAVRQELLDAHVQPQDMPKRILSVKDVGARRYQVQMEMVQGVAWFEVWWDGSRWQVRGMNAGPH